MRERDLTMTPTEYLPPGLEHVRFPDSAGHLAAFKAMQEAGQVTVHGSIIRAGGTVYTTVRRNGPQPRRSTPTPQWALPALGIAVILAGLAVVTALVAYLVNQSGPAVGFVLALALVLFVAVAYDRRKTRAR